MILRVCGTLIEMMSFGAQVAVDEDRAPLAGHVSPCYLSLDASNAYVTSPREYMRAMPTLGANTGGSTVSGALEERHGQAEK